MERMFGYARLCRWSLLVLALAGCASNRAWQDVVIRPNTEFDLAFVEFTERGNVFDRDRMHAVLNHVELLAKRPDGVLVVVFTHGWKHNASSTDPNVVSFTEWLNRIARLEVTKGQRNRRVIGVYIGWRGLSLGLGPLANVTYWERKAVAHEVGKGGVTEFLLRLDRLLVDKTHPNKNLSLVVGHSFGGAIVLTALNEILLERVINAEAGQPCGEKSKPGCTECYRTRPFGHGVVLLNPAIEANEVLQLKEAVAQTCFARNQSRLLHVISSDNDQATNKAFRFGQSLWGLRQSQTRFDRRFGDQQITFDESDLDATTVGNFKSFQTGQLSKPEKTGGEWTYRNCVADPNKSCLAAEDKPRHIPVWRHEPLAFIHTDKEFIENHNDIFNNNVAAYLAAIVVEARLLRTGDEKDILPAWKREDGSFNFGACLLDFLKRFGAISKPGNP